MKLRRSPGLHRRKVTTTVVGEYLDALLATSHVGQTRPGLVVQALVQDGLDRLYETDDRVRAYVDGVREARQVQTAAELEAKEEQVQALRRRKEFRVIRSPE